MRLLALDIGTNSTLWLIAEVESGRVRLIERGIAGNRLGAGKRDDGSLPQEVIELNREILRGIVKQARELGCTQMKGVATQALRSTSNSDNFIRMAAEEGLLVEIISGEREAQLAWAGVFDDGSAEGVVGLLDIGGGSSELSVGGAAGPDFSESLTVGAVTLTEHFKADPPAANEVAHVTSLVRNQLSGWKEKLPAEAPLVGVAGTVTALAALEVKLEHYVPGVIEGAVLTREVIEKWRNKLLTHTLCERRRLPGMPPVRAEFIPAGAIILAEVMRTLDREDVTVSEKGVMFGLALEMGRARG